MNVTNAIYVSATLAHEVSGSAPNPDVRALADADDTLEFFNLILGTKLAAQEKQDLVALLRAL